MPTLLTHLARELQSTTCSGDCDQGRACTCRPGQWREFAKTQPMVQQLAAPPDAVIARQPAQPPWWQRPGVVLVLSTAAAALLIWGLL